MQLFSSFFASEPSVDRLEADVANYFVEYSIGRIVFLLCVSSDRAPLTAVPTVATE